MPAPPSGLSADARLRAEVVALLRGGNAHVRTAEALAGLPPERVNERPAGLPYSLWELLWHLHFAQADILEFVRGPYAEKAWPDAYWPDRDASTEEWETTRAAFLADLDAAVALAEEADLLAELPHAPGYTVLRELLLIADHNAHHVGEVIVLRRLLGLWG